MSSHIRSVEDAASYMIGMLESVIPAEIICIALHNQTAHHVIASLHRSGEPLRTGFELPLFRVASSGESHPVTIVELPTIDGDDNAFDSELARAFPGHSFVGALVRKHDADSYSGSICLIDSKPLRLSGEHKALLSRAASLFGYVIELEDASLTDSLTGLYNRRYLHHILNRGTDKQYSVLFIDIDDFKVVNDQHGHDTGDALLQKIAIRLRQNIRKSDILIRYGGDEFLVCCQHLTENHDMHFVADKIKSTLRQPYTIEDKVLQVSASVGISAGHGDSASLKELITNADHAMYNKKMNDKTP